MSLNLEVFICHSFIMSSLCFLTDLDSITESESSSKDISKRKKSYVLRKGSLWTSSTGSITADKLSHAVKTQNTYRLEPSENEKFILTASLKKVCLFNSTESNIYSTCF